MLGTAAVTGDGDEIHAFSLPTVPNMVWPTDNETSDCSVVRGILVKQVQSTQRHTQQSIETSLYHQGRLLVGGEAEDHS